MKTSELQGALLDYWTARAEGVPADQLEIRPVQRPDPRTPDTICVRLVVGGLVLPTGAALRYDPSTNWALTGPLVEKWSMDFGGPCWRAVAWKGGYWIEGIGDTPLIAICRAVVRAAFGDEVEDLPC